MTDEGRLAAQQWARRTAREQGLPEVVTDLGVLAKVATLVHGPGPRASWALESPETPR